MRKYTIAIWVSIAALISFVVGVRAGGEIGYAKAKYEHESSRNILAGN